jgi:hypothetical protein
LVCVALAAAGGCEPTCEPVALDARGLAPAWKVDDLAVVLDEAVDDDGLLDADALRKHADRLDAQLRLFAVTGPTTQPKLLPTREHVIAYWYNARAAWALKLWLLRDCPEELRDAELRQRPFPLDGRVRSLAEIDAILAGDEDFRTVVAAPGITRQRAPLPREPFTASDVRRRMAERFAALIDDKERFVVDADKQRVLVPPVLWQFRDRLVRAHHAAYGTRGATLTTALLARVTGSPHRRLQDAVGYDCRQARPRNEVARAK